MPLLHPLGDPIPLSACLDEVEAGDASWTWLYINRSTSKLSDGLRCHPQPADAPDMNDGEFDEFEQAIERVGLKEFLNCDQIQDVVDNLRDQRSEYSRQQLLDAIDFYWRHDAFIEVSEDAA